MILEYWLIYKTQLQLFCKSKKAKSDLYCKFFTITSTIHFQKKKRIHIYEISFKSIKKLT